MAELIAEVRRLRGVNEAIGLLKGFVEVENQTLRNLLREARIHCANGFKDVPEKLDVLARIDALLGATDSQNVSREVEKGDR